MAAGETAQLAWLAKRRSGGWRPSAVSPASVAEKQLISQPIVKAGQLNESVAIVKEAK